MATLTVYDKTGSEVGKVDVDAEKIASRISHQLLHDAVVMYQANLRQGSQHTKSRGFVAGSTKKMYRQKGTGNARAGSRRSNVRRGGGHAFAIRNRDYRYRLPRKALQTATRMAMASKLDSAQVKLIDQFDFSQPQTGEMAKVLKALELQNTTSLIVTDQVDSNVYKSARNIPGTQVVPISDINAYLLLRPRQVLMTRAAMDWVQENMTETVAKENAASKNLAKRKVETESVAAE